MKIKNSTRYSMATALGEAVCDYPTEGITVELKYCPKGSKRYISGTYYRKARGFENGKLIRLRINRFNKYPLEVQFKTSEYYSKRDMLGREQTYQRLKTVRFETAEDLILAIFLHEFSHYLDHVDGRNGRYKQTKADKFALAILEKLEVI
jgi:5-hydroxyisourate hydrolase-like protein (transthyretin family)